MTHLVACAVIGFGTGSGIYFAATRGFPKLAVLAVAIGLGVTNSLPPLIPMS